jgi:hypothetical protein
LQYWLISNCSRLLMAIVLISSSISYAGFFYCNARIGFAGKAKQTHQRKAACAIRLVMALFFIPCFIAMAVKKQGVLIVFFDFVTGKDV